MVFHPFFLLKKATGNPMAKQGGNYFSSAVCLKNSATI